MTLCIGSITQYFTKTRSPKGSDRLHERQLVDYQNILIVFKKDIFQGQIHKKAIFQGQVSPVSVVSEIKLYVCPGYLQL